MESLLDIKVACDLKVCHEPDMRSTGLTLYRHYIKKTGLSRGICPFWTFPCLIKPNLKMLTFSDIISYKTNCVFRIAFLSQVIFKQ